ncbi:MAG: hypothetical protein ABIR29_09580 [Chthoniobacterales bacterium]
MGATNSPFSSKLNLAPPLPVDLSERIWRLHRIITDSAIKHSKVKDAKRALLGALLVRNELSNISVRPISKKAARANSSSVRATHFAFLAPDQFLFSVIMAFP